MKRRTWFLVVIMVCICFTKSFSQELKSIQLLAPKFDEEMTLLRALKNRRSLREFSKEKLPLQIISNLLWAASGINRSDSGKRTAPSAVDWQEIDIYIAMTDGLFLFDAKRNLLQPVLAKDIRASVGKQRFVQDAPVNLIYVADFTKMGSASNEDKKFYSATDTGFISQNVYLYCAAQGLSTVVLGWVDKDALAQEMKLRSEQKVILTQPVGYPKK